MLYDLSEIHHADGIAQVLHHPQIVAYEKK